MKKWAGRPRVRPGCGSHRSCRPGRSGGMVMPMRPATIVVPANICTAARSHIVYAWMHSPLLAGAASGQHPPTTACAHPSLYECPVVERTMSGLSTLVIDLGSAHSLGDAPCPRQVGAISPTDSLSCSILPQTVVFSHAIGVGVFEHLWRSSRFQSGGRSHDPRSVKLLCSPPESITEVCLRRALCANTVMPATSCSRDVTKWKDVWRRHNIQGANADRGRPRLYRGQRALGKRR